MPRMAIEAAGKYAAVTSAAKPARTAASLMPRGHQGDGGEQGQESSSGASASARPPLSLALKKAGPAFAGVPFPGKARREPRPTGSQTSGLHLFVPKQGRPLTVGEWFWRELREGGYVREYLRAEKALMAKAIRKVARRKHGWKQNFKSDMQLLASVPARLFFRWKAVDPHFWEDDKNLKSLKRDNPDLPIFL